MTRILIVDDERSIRRTLGAFLRAAGYEVAEAEDADAALAQLQAAAFDVVVTDIVLPRVTGVELLRLIQDAAPDVQVVMMTGEPTVETAAEALRLGAADYLFKPIDKAAILRAAGNAARIKDLEDTRRRLEAENQAHREHLERLVVERTAQLQASEVRYRNLVETAFDWVWEVDAEGRYTYASPRVFDLLGYRPEEVLGRTPFDLMPAAEARRIQPLFEQLAAQREPFVMLENTNRHREGHWVTLETSGMPILSPTGEFLGYRGMDRDITGRKQAEAAIRRQSDLLASVNHVLSLGLGPETEEELCVACLSEIENITGSQISFIGELGADGMMHDLAVSNPTWDVCRMTDTSGHRRPPGNFRLRGLFGRVFDTGQSLIANDPANHPDGIGFPAGHPPLTAFLAVPLQRQGKTSGMIAVGNRPGGYGSQEQQDLEVLAPAILEALDRKRAEAALRESERKHRTLFEGSRDAILTLDPVTHRFLACNPAAVKMLGAKSEAELVALGPAQFSPERQPDGRLSSTAVLETDATVMEEGTRFFEWRHRRLNGEEFAADVLLARIEWDGRPAIMATVRDITDRKQAEAELRRLATAVEQAVEGILITDTAGVMLYVNPAFERITGYTRQEALGQKPRILKSDKHDQAFYRQLWDTLTRGEVWQGHFINKKKDGSLYEEDATISPVRDAAGNIVHFVAVTRDVTAQVALEAQLRQAQKMEAIGTLASGVAHEINNPLFGIRGYAELIADSLPPESQLSESVAAIIRQTDHVAEIVRNLLTFARQDKQEARLADPHAIIQSVLSLLRTVVRHDHITLQVDIPEGLPPVACRGQQLEQVLMNLLTNARDALNEKHAGHQDDKRIRVSAGVIDRDGAPWLRMTVEDHGAGIPRHVRERIFDPFYTTKPAGKGTGLGLSISHGIVKDHGGELHFETEPGRGTRFHVDLPLNAGTGPTVP